MVVVLHRAQGGQARLGGLLEERRAGQGVLGRVGSGHAEQASRAAAAVQSLQQQGSGHDREGDQQQHLAVRRVLGDHEGRGEGHHAAHPGPADEEGPRGRRRVGVQAPGQPGDVDPGEAYDDDGGERGPADQGDATRRQRRAGVAVLTINDSASQFVNHAGIQIALGSAANPYPSTINVTNGPPSIGSMRVTLYDVSHAFPDNIDVLLQAPGGQTFLLMADAGGAIPVDPNAPVTLTFSDDAGQVLPDSTMLTTGKFEPTSWEANQSNFPNPAPAGPYNQPGSAVGGTGTQTLAGNFGLTNSNGLWKLFVRDDNGTLSPETLNGEITGGWGLEFLGASAAGVTISGRVTTPDGRGLRNAQVTIIDSQGFARTVRTTSFGSYRFDDVETGASYVIGVNAKRYRFESRLLQVFDSLADVDFVGIE